MSVHGKRPPEPDRLRDEPDHDRRHFLLAAGGMLAAPLGLGGLSQASQREPRHLAALRRATAWINVPSPSTLNLLGKVVLVQFGTYTCINWLRTLPYIRAWDQQYRPGLVVIGVHTPEFTFEKNLENVRRALQDMKIEFPIAVDSDQAIWRAFNNQYWPALYFIDARGRVRDQHFGEGEYERSERTIRRLLAGVGETRESDAVVPVAATGFELQADWRNLKTPEMYLGYDRGVNFSSAGGVARGRQRLYAAPKRVRLNEWALAGEWTVASEPAILAQAPGRIVCGFHARDVHLVMGPARPEHEIRFRVTIDGQRPGPAHGLDVDEGGSGTVREQRLYQLVRQPGPIVDRTVEIEFLDPGLEAFSFTFG